MEVDPNLVWGSFWRGFAVIGIGLPLIVILGNTWKRHKRRTKGVRIEWSESRAINPMNSLDGWYRIDTIAPAHEDDRRSITAVFNGDFNARQVKVLRLKQTSILGNHYHDYKEMFYVLSGEAKYWLEDVDTGRRATLRLMPGNRLFINARVAHKAELRKYTIMIEATEEPYISAENNDVRYEVKNA